MGTEKENTKIERLVGNEMFIESTSKVFGWVLSYGVSRIVFDVIEAVVPAPVKVGAKITRHIGEAGLSLILDQTCEKATKEYLTDGFNWFEERRSDKELLENIVKNYEKEHPEITNKKKLYKEAKKELKELKHEEERAKALRRVINKLDAETI